MTTPETQKYARAASKGFSYLVPTTVNTTLKKLLKKLPPTARLIYKDYYGDIMASRACAQISANALAAFVDESFPKISADHNRLAKLMNAAIDEDEHDGYAPVKFPIVDDGTAAGTDDEEEQAPQSRKRPGVFSRPKGKRAKGVKTSHALQEVEPSTLEPELRGVLWSTGTVANPENEAVAMAVLEPESREQSSSSLFPTIVNREISYARNPTAFPSIYSYPCQDEGGLQDEVDVLGPVLDFANTLVSHKNHLTLPWSPTIANMETIYPLNASSAPSVRKPVEDTVGNAQGDTLLFAPAVDFEPLFDHIINDTVEAGAFDEFGTTHVTENTIKSFGIKFFDMPLSWNDLLWTPGNWVDGLEATDALLWA